jgi:ABC-type Fe3+-siderophore transport system permease subunit
MVAFSGDIGFVGLLVPHAARPPLTVAARGLSGLGADQRRSP